MTSENSHLIITSKVINILNSLPDTECDMASTLCIEHQIAG